MKVYLWHMRPMAVVEDLSVLVKKSLKNVTTFQKCWSDFRGISQAFPFEIVLQPGDAMYFMGGHESLADQFRHYTKFTIKTSCGSGLVMGGEDGIKLSNSDRIGGFLGSKLDIYTGAKSVKALKAEYDEVRRKTITCLCLYNADVADKTAPNCVYKNKMMPDHITLGEICQKLRQFYTTMAVAQIGAKVAARYGAVTNLMDQLNI